MVDDFISLLGHAWSDGYAEGLILNPCLSSPEIVVKFDDLIFRTVDSILLGKKLSDAAREIEYRISEDMVVDSWKDGYVTGLLYGLQRI